MCHNQSVTAEMWTRKLGNSKTQRYDLKQKSPTASNNPSMCIPWSSLYVLYSIVYKSMCRIQSKKKKKRSITHNGKTPQSLKIFYVHFVNSNTTMLKV